MKKYGDCISSKDKSYEIPWVHPRHKRVITTVYKNDNDNETMKVWADRTIYSEVHLNLKPAVVYDESKVEVWDGPSSHSESSSSVSIAKPTTEDKVLKKKQRVNP